MPDLVIVVAGERQYHLPLPLNITLEDGQRIVLDKIAAKTSGLTVISFDGEETVVWSKQT